MAKDDSRNTEKVDSAGLRDVDDDGESAEEAPRGPRWADWVLTKNYGWREEAFATLKFPKLYENACSRICHRPVESEYLGRRDCKAVF